MLIVTLIVSVLMPLSVDTELNTRSVYTFKGPDAMIHCIQEKKGQEDTKVSVRGSALIVSECTSRDTDNRDFFHPWF